MSERYRVNLYLKCWNWEVLSNLVHHFIGQQPDHCIPFLAHHYPRLLLKILEVCWRFKRANSQYHDIYAEEEKARCNKTHPCMAPFICGFFDKLFTCIYYLYLQFINQLIEDSMASISDCPASLANSIGERLSGSLTL